MKLNNGISLGNVLTIIALVVSVAISFGSISNNMDQMKTDIDKKANREMVDIQFEYIQRELSDIKDLIKKGRK